jgi:hypothetical protein
MRRIVSFVVALALAIPLGPASVATAEDPLPLVLITAHSKALLAEAVTQGRPTVVILVTTRPNTADGVASDLVALGATILSKDHALGYVSAIIPTSRVEAASRLRNVEVVDLDEVLPLELPAPDGATDVQVDPPGAGTSTENPYMPTRDIGAPQFVAANPAYDGRGTTIGIIDTGVDLFTPELQTTTTGERKIVDWVTFTHPLVDPDPTWLNMASAVTVSGGSFTAGGVTYTGVPTDGTYRFSTLNENALGATSEFRACGNTGADLDRDGTCGDVFAVLWDTASNSVIVDSNADRSFSGERSMREYRIAFDVGTFGRDNPATPIRESVPFVIQLDKTNGFVNIGIVSGAHGTHVAGIAAGKDFFGGVFDGAAPGARLVSVRVCLFVSGCTARALIDGMIYAAKTARSDVINMSIGGLPFLNDGNNTRARVYNRLIEHEKVQMFISAGNSGPGTNTVGDPSVASLVMSVGSYIHKDTWASNYGAAARKDDGLHPFTSRGPREDGGFKPNIVAPGAAVSTIPGWQPGAPVTAGTPAAPIYALPPGYGMFNGTSMAAPQAAGGAALLVSAAKQTGAQHTPDRLRQAISSSARYLPYYGAYEQGTGLMNVGAAWDLLRTNLRPVTITSSVPVRTSLSHLLATPNVGVGIHDREGVKPGDTYVRTYTFTRTDGPGGAITYAVRWVGNDGTFSSASSVTLPRGSAVQLPVSITVGGVGVHSALLQLDDPATAGIDLQTMNVVVAAHQLTAANSFTVEVTGSADRTDTAQPHQFFSVPAGATGMRITSTVVPPGRMRTLRYHPAGVPFDSTTTTPYCGGVDTGTGCPGGVVTRTAANPAPGTWEVTVDTSRASAVDPATYVLRVELFGVSVSPSSWTVEPATVGNSYTERFSFANQGATFAGGASGTALATAFATEGTMTKGSGSLSQDIRWVRVPAGSTSLTVQLRQGSDAAADLDVFVFFCGADGQTCGAAPVGQGIGSTTNENVVVPSPPPGVYKVVVEEFSIPAGTTTYGYLDEIAKSGYGTITVVDAPATRTPGATWEADAVASVQASPNDARFDPADPASARFLRGFVQVTSAGSVLGSAEARFYAP